MGVEKTIKEIKEKDDFLLEEGNIISPNELLPKIRKFRETLQKNYADANYLPDESRSSIQSLCNIKDKYWAHRERCITGEFTYVLPALQ